MKYTLNSSSENSLIKKVKILHIYLIWCDMLEKGIYIQVSANA